MAVPMAEAEGMLQYIIYVWRGKGGRMVGLRGVEGAGERGAADDGGKQG